MVQRVATVAFRASRPAPWTCSARSRPAAGLQYRGLPDKAVRRQRSAWRAGVDRSGLALPARRIPSISRHADLPKEGSHYDCRSRSPD